MYQEGLYATIEVMNYHKVSDGYLLKFSKDEKLVENLTASVKEHKIRAAWLMGLGGAQGVELGFYNLEQQEYEWHTVTHLAEITNLTGNIAWQNNSPAPHIHITLSDNKLRSFGGHLKELIVGGTVEVNLTVLDKKLERSFDQETGLNLLNI